ncbi:MAG: hypothetical protein OHK0015_50170 [Chloroflexi bacterium OHK40]
MSTVRELIAATFSGEAYPLAPWYAALLEASPPLRGFSATNAPKIRKKARQARTPDEQRDLRCELAVAAALMDRRSPLSYEPLAAPGRRGPDFLLRYKGHTTVYVEVSRMRPPRSEEPDHAGRVAALLCGKLGQLVAGAANLLVIVSDAGPHPNEDIGAIPLFRASGAVPQATTTPSSLFAASPVPVPLPNSCHVSAPCCS